MNYRHAFHAGNHADVLKHIVLLFCLDALKRKPAPFGALDTHAGRGRYDLFSAEAMRSPEWQRGIGELWDWPGAPALVTRLRDAIRVQNADGVLRFYPGSPALIADTLRADDTLEACELHPEEYAALRGERLGRNVHVHERDGWEALAGLLPLKQRRGLVLIDPPYEAEDELAHAADAIGNALQRFRQGVFVWWRPLKRASALAMADAELAAHGLESLRADFWIAPPALEGPLTASSVLVVNPPFGLAPAMRETLPPLATRLGGGAGGWRLS